MEKLFEFRKIRDFGGILNDSFDFIKLEYKRLGKALLIYLLPFLVVTAAANVFLQSNYYSALLNEGITYSSNPLQSYNWGSMFGMYTILFLNYTVLSSVVLAFIKTYRSNNGEFEVSDISSLLIPYSFKLLVAYLISGLLTILGFVLLIIPGIYLGIVFTLIAPILIFEDVKLGDALNRCFFLIRSNWWRTFGILVLGSIIVSLISLVVSLPMIIFTAVNSFHALKDNNPEAIFSTSYLVINAVVSVIQHLVYGLLIILIAINYFSLVEAKERPTLQERIDNLNSENA